jgi:myosin-15
LFSRFENFKDNSFEQLCINFANESIHHFLTRFIFKLEQAEYAKEKIDWVPIDFEDNAPIISLLVKKPVGILHLLDDESNFPKGKQKFLSFLKQKFNKRLFF